MLHEKLEQASKEAAAKRQKFTLVTLGVVAFAGLFLLSLSLFRELTELRHAQGVIDAKVELRNAENTLNEAGPQENVERPKKPNRIVGDSVGTKAPHSASIDKSIVVDSVGRDNFMRELKSFEDELEPQILNVGFQEWSEAGQGEILTLKDSAISAFGTGNYKQALELIRQAADKATLSLNAMEVEFRQALANAKISKDKDDFETAAQQIELALRLKPDSPEAQKLEREIQALPEILKQLRAVQTARVENNLQEEYERLKFILSLDPSREQIRERATFLANEIREQEFSRFVSDALASLDLRDLKVAQQSLDGARNIFPDRDEISILANKVAELDRDLQTNKLLEDAKVAAQSDNWPQSLKLYSKASEIQPNNHLAVDGISLARSVITLHEQILQHVQAPHRLAAKNVANMASDLVRQGRALSGNSRLLDTQVKVLSDVLALYAAKVPIRVVSDGQTLITVRGVGRVGVTKEKLIELNPGNYTFEGACPGYKSKFVSVSIPPGSEHFMVEVICDERI